MIYYYNFKDALKAQKEKGGTIWFDGNKNAYYLFKGVTENVILESDCK